MADWAVIYRVNDKHVVEWKNDETAARKRANELIENDMNLMVFLAEEKFSVYVENNITFKEAE